LILKQQLKLVNFFNSALHKGCRHNLKINNSGSMSIEENTGYSAYFSHMFDTNDIDMTYNRLMLKANLKNCKYEIIVSAFNETDVFIDDKLINTAEYINSVGIPAEKKVELLKSCNHIRIVNHSDILLHELTGRYLFVYIGIYSQLDSYAEIAGFGVEFPKYSFSEYFPEIYQENNGFFEKYLAIFQSIYLDNEKLVDNVPRLLDYQTTPDEFIQTIAEWVGIDNKDKLFNNNQIRFLIQNADIFQGLKGTKEVLKKNIELFLGVNPVIVEHFQWYYVMQKNKDRQKQYEKMYGDTSDYFAIIIDTTKLALSFDEVKLNKLIKKNIPLGAKYKLILLSKCNHTDINCYLGLNSNLSVPEVAVTDGFVLGSHSTIG